MITNETSANVAVTTATEADRASSFHQTYHELAERHLVEVDVLEKLKANIAQLEDLHGRLRFMMAEITYLLKKN